MTYQRVRLLLVAALAIGLSGCQYFHATAHKLTITPVAANAPLRSAAAPEDALYARAVVAINQRDYGLALDVLQLAREDRANDPRVFTAMGVVYDKLGRFDLSKRYYDLAEAADPGSKFVAIDRAYSLVLQQRILTPAAPSATMLAAAPAVMVLAAAPAPSPVVLIGHPIVLRNATGSPHGVDLVRARLNGKGWRLRAGDVASRASPTSELRFPPKDQQAANGLSRTLAFPVKLESCPTCLRLELVIGTNAVPTKSGRRLPKVQHA